MTQNTSVNRLDEIRARLAAATPGPWANAHYGYVTKPHDGHEEPGMPGVVGICNCGFERDLPDGQETGNADLIANAPTDLALLEDLMRVVLLELGRHLGEDGLRGNLARRLTRTIQQAIGAPALEIGYPGVHGAASHPNPEQGALNG